MKNFLISICSVIGYILGFVILVASMVVMVPIYLGVVVFALLLEIIFFPITIIIWMSSGFLLHKQIEKSLDYVNRIVEKNSSKK